VKDALEVPLPWSRRGTLLPKTEPLLVEVVAAFSGELAGTLDPRTPRPPLVSDAFARIDAAGIMIGEAPKTATLALRAPKDLEKSRVLHRLRVLAVPGFVRERAATDRD